MRVVRAISHILLILVSFCYLSQTVSATTLLQATSPLETAPAPLAGLLGMELPTPRLSARLHPIERLYDRAFYGDPRSLEELKQQDGNAALACIVMLRYHLHVEPDQGSPYLRKLEHLLGDQKTALESFIPFGDPDLNIAFASYHRDKKNSSIAERFARHVITQGSSEGYNTLACVCLMNSQGEQARQH